MATTMFTHQWSLSIRKLLTEWKKRGRHFMETCWDRGEEGNKLALYNLFECTLLDRRGKQMRTHAHAYTNQWAENSKLFSIRAFHIPIIIIVIIERRSYQRQTIHTHNYPYIFFICLHCLSFHDFVIVLLVFRVCAVVVVVVSIVVLTRIMRRRCILYCIYTIRKSWDAHRNWWYGINMVISIVCQSNELSTHPCYITHTHTNIVKLLLFVRVFIRYCCCCCCCHT